MQIVLDNNRFSPIKISRVLIGVLLLLCITFFFIQLLTLPAISTTLVIADVGHIILVSTFLLLSFKKTFIGLLVPTILYAISGLISITGLVAHWDWNANYIGFCLTLIIISYFLIRGVVAAYIAEKYSP